MFCRKSRNPAEFELLVSFRGVELFRGVKLFRGVVSLCRGGCSGGCKFGTVLGRLFGRVDLACRGRFYPGGDNCDT